MTTAPKMTGNTPELPRYKSHKIVQAALITGIERSSSLNGYLHLEGQENPIIVDKEYMLKHRPEVGGYYVLYPDNYESFSPAQAFADGYTPIDE